MADWEFRYEEPGGSYVALGVDFENDTGTPLYSGGIEILSESSGYFSNPLVSGIYTITFSDSTHVTISSHDTRDRSNPYLSSSSLTVSDTDWNYNLIPGLRIKFSSPQAGDVGRIGIGCDLVQPVLEDPPYWIREMALGPIVGGEDSDVIHLRLYNVSGYTQTGCKAYITNAIRVENVTSNSRPFQWFKQWGPLNPTPDVTLLGNAITFDNYTVGTYFPTVDILLNDSPVSVYDVKNDTLKSDGTGLGLDTDNEFQFSSGTKLQSGRFMLSESLQESDVAVVYVSDGGDFFYLSDDGNTYVSGTTGIDLTETDESTGVVTTGGYADIYIKATIPVNSTADLNLRLFSLRVGGGAVFAGGE
jgi:hypothetical protein